VVDTTQWIGWPDGGPYRHDPKGQWSDVVTHDALARPPPDLTTLRALFTDLRSDTARIPSLTRWRPGGGQECARQPTSSSFCGRFSDLLSSAVE